MICFSIPANVLHLIKGAVSLWTRPRPCTCVQGPKNSSHQLITTTISCPKSARQRACRQPCPGPPGNDVFLNSGNCENSTVSTTTAPGICKPAQQGHRSPCQRTAAGKSQWSKQTGPWDKPLRHDREICTTSTTWYSNWRESMV